MVNPERFNQSMFNFRAALRSLFNYSGTLNEERWTNIDWEFVTARHANDVNQYRSMADCQEFFMTVLAILGDSHIITITPQRVRMFFCAFYFASFDPRRMIYPLHPCLHSSETNHNFLDYSGKHFTTTSPNSSMG